MADTSPSAKIETFLSNFSQALENQDLDALQSLFAPDCYWRDLVAFTWNIKTMEGRAAIAEMAAQTLPHVNPKKLGP